MKRYFGDEAKNVEGTKGKGKEGRPARKTKGIEEFTRR